MSQQQQKKQQFGDVTYKDQMREARLPSSSLSTAEGSGERAAAATITDDIPIVGAVVVSESRMAAEEHEDRLQEAERRATAAEAARQDQEVRLAQLERQMAAVLPPSLQQVRDIGNLNDDRLEVIDGDDNNDDDEENTNGQQQQQRQQPQQHNQNNDGTANEGNNNSGGNSSPKQPSQRRRCCLLVVVVAVLIAAAGVVAGICGTGRCSSAKTSPVPQPLLSPPVPQAISQPVPQPISQAVPPPVPSPVSPPVSRPASPPEPVPVSSTIPTTATARANSILSYINSITVSGRTLTYPSSSRAEERAVQWLIDDDLNTTVADKQSLRQRYVLGALWFLNTTTGFGSADYAATWTTNLDECKTAKILSIPLSILTTMMTTKRTGRSNNGNNKWLARSTQVRERRTSRMTVTTIVAYPLPNSSHNNDDVASWWWPWPWLR
jgi:hypothetical protein